MSSIWTELNDVVSLQTGKISRQRKALSRSRKAIHETVLQHLGVDRKHCTVQKADTDYDLLPIGAPLQLDFGLDVTFSKKKNADCTFTIPYQMIAGDGFCEVAIDDQAVVLNVEPEIDSKALAKIAVLTEECLKKAVGRFAGIDKKDTKLVSVSRAESKGK